MADVEVSCDLCRVTCQYRRLAAKLMPSVPQTMRTRQQHWTHSGRTGFDPFTGNSAVLTMPARLAHSTQLSRLALDRPLSRYLHAHNRRHSELTVRCQTTARTATERVRQTDRSRRRGSTQTSYSQGVHTHPFIGAHDDAHLRSRLVSNLCQTKRAEFTHHEPDP